MGGGQGQQALDAMGAVAGQIGATDQATHAMGDQRELLAAGGGADFLDALVQLRNQLAHAGIGRRQTDRGNGMTGRFESTSQQPPDAA